AGKQKALMRLNRARALAGDVHRLRTVTISAFQGIVGLHARPFMLGQIETMIDKFLSRIDRSKNLSPDLLGSLHLARDLVGPFMGYMAIGTAGAHARAIVVVHRRF